MFVVASSSSRRTFSSRSSIASITSTTTAIGTTATTATATAFRSSCSSSALFTKRAFASTAASSSSSSSSSSLNHNRRMASSSSSSPSEFRFSRPSKLQNFGPTVWHEFTPLAQKYNAANLGQGFPNYDGPAFILEAAKKAIDSGLNQYTRSQGHLRLVNALASFYSPKFERKINPLTEILTTVGASEALFSTISALVNPGDEVILVEPFFDIYYGAVEMSGAVPKYLPMRREANSSQKGGIASSSEWKIDPKELEKVLTDRSKLLILNTPHNPTGKVLKRDELEAIAEVVKKHPQLIVISDEVYEFMTYDGVQHERIAKVPGMWERTVTISSAGKTFSSTGWKVGWCVGPENLISAISVVHSYIPFSIPTPLQEAVAVGFEEAESRNYFAEFQANYLKRRDKLVSALVDAGLNPMMPEGSFFVLADASTIKPKDADGKDVDLIELAKKVSITGTQLDVPDYNLGRWFTTQVGVAVIPVSAFVSESHQSWYPYIRFCFCKTDDVLDEACKRLRALKK